MKNIFLIFLLLLGSVQSSIGQNNAATAGNALEEVSQELSDTQKRNKRLEELSLIIKADTKSLENLRKKNKP